MSVKVTSIAQSSTVDKVQPSDFHFLQYWWPVFLGLLVLYVPTYVDLASGPWTKDQNAHGPIVLAVVLWLIWQNRSVFATSEFKPNNLLGGITFGFGLLLYIFGRSQDILIFEVVSQIPVLIGTAVLIYGTKVVRSLWFPLFFLIFLIPLPGFVIDSVTGSLKQQVSVLVEHILYWFGYPVARSGVVLTVGPYQLLIADACSGLNSMFALSAMGILYIYLTARKNLAHNFLLLLSLLPIAFLTNVIRVITLVLVTYYFGDEAGQGFVHDFAGIMEFIIALLLLFLLDAILVRVFKMRGAN